MLAVRVAALHHEAGDHLMEKEAVIGLLTDELQEIIPVDRRLVVQGDDEVAELGTHLHQRPRLLHAGLGQGRPSVQEAR